MSDYRLNSEKNDISYQGYSCGNNFLSRQFNNNLNLFNRDVGISSKEKFFNPKERSDTSRKQRKLFRPGSPEIGRNNMDASYIGEVERISSSLIKLLWQSRQNHVNAATSVSQRLQLLQSIAPQAESNQALCCQTDRHFIHSSKDIPESTSSLRTEHEQNIPGGMCDSSNKSAPESTDRLFLPTDEETAIINPLERRNCEIGATRSRLLKVEDRQRGETYHKPDKRSSIRTNRVAGLRGMLPEDIDRSHSQGKGSLMKESVDTVKELRKIQEQIRQLEAKMRERDIQIKILALRIERLEFVNTGKNENLRGIDVRQNEVSPKDRHINSGLTMFPVSQGSKPRPDLTLKESRPDIRKTLTLPLAIDEVRESLSTTSSDDSATTSSPGCYERDTNRMDCNN